jgi:drug/metabolite transporter (DMT)-like permease
VGEFFALAAAVVWGFAVILFRKSGETLSAFALNLFRVGITSVVFLIVLPVLRQPLLPDLPLELYLRLIISGVIGIAISDTFLHRGLNLAGAGISAIASCLYSPFIALFAFLLIDERLRPCKFFGMALVVGGVLLTTSVDPPRGSSRRNVIFGIFWGICSMATVALSIVIAKPALMEVPVVWATALRQFASLLVMLPVALASPRRRSYFAAFRPSRAWRFSLSGTLLGSCLALLFWIAGMKYTQVGLAAILNQTATLWVLLFATLFLKEPFGRRKLAATALAVAGILLVTLC